MAEYIERERTVELLRSLGNREYRKEKGTIQDAIKMISYPEYTPAADGAPVVHGRWEFLGPNRLIGDCMCGTCSVCKVRCKYIVNKNICPNCGAKMYGDRKEGADNG